jgi:hypothetical protein
MKTISICIPDPANIDDKEAVSASRVDSPHSLVPKEEETLWLFSSYHGNENNFGIRK